MSLENALVNLKMIGIGLIVVGIIAISSVVIYIDKLTMSDRVFDSLFGIAVIYIGYIILSSSQDLSQGRYN